MVKNLLTFPGSIPGWGRYSGEGNGHPLQYSCLENPMDRGAWWATVHSLLLSIAHSSPSSESWNYSLFACFLPSSRHAPSGALALKTFRFFCWFLEGTSHCWPWLACLVGPSSAHLLEAPPSAATQLPRKLEAALPSCQFPWRCPLTAKMPLLDQGWLEVTRVETWLPWLLWWAFTIFPARSDIRYVSPKSHGFTPFFFPDVGGIKHFGKGLSATCISVNSWGMWLCFLDHNIRTSLFHPDLIPWLNGICLNSYPHCAKPGAMCLQILFLSLHCFALYHKETAFTTTPTPVGQLPTVFNGRHWQDSGAGGSEKSGYFSFSFSAFPPVPSSQWLLTGQFPSGDLRSGVQAHCSWPRGGIFCWHESMGCSAGDTQEGVHCLLKLISPSPSFTLNWFF